MQDEYTGGTDLRPELVVDSNQYGHRFDLGYMSTGGAH